jgi:hypothetical protein
MTTRSVSEWEAKFRSWSGGPGDTELARCDNAERMIKKAVDASLKLKNLDIDVFAQGSFKNVTNIAQESDVDISVCLRQAWYYEIPAGTTTSDFHIGATDLEYAPFREDVTDAITSYFGAPNVSNGNKAIRVHSNTYRVDADVVPSWEFREYYDKDHPLQFRSGVRFCTEDGNWITNYPKQHIQSGIDKNELTKRRFKRIARVLKSLQVEMIDEKIASRKLPSFLIESLTYNVPNEDFGADNYRDDVRAVLAHIFNCTLPSGDSSQWMEVNGIKYLFHVSQSWTKADAHTFADLAWNYLGFT